MIYVQRRWSLISERRDTDVPIDKLKEIIIAKSNDPELYDGYKLDSEQLDKLNTYLKERITPQFEKFSYYLVAGGIYNW